MQIFFFTFKNSGIINFQLKLNNSFVITMYFQLRSMTMSNLTENKIRNKLYKVLLKCLVNLQRLEKDGPGKFHFEIWVFGVSKVLP